MPQVNSQQQSNTLSKVTSETNAVAPLKSMRDVRRFLLETMQGTRDGTIKVDAALAISKLVAQLNQTIVTEIDLRLKHGNDVILIEDVSE